MGDLATKEDIAFLVEKFYQAILKNKFLSPFFENINFKEHLQNDSFLEFYTS